MKSSGMRSIYLSDEEYRQVLIAAKLRGLDLTFSNLVRVIIGERLSVPLEARQWGGARGNNGSKKRRKKSAQ